MAGMGALIALAGLIVIAAIVSALVQRQWLSSYLSREVSSKMPELLNKPFLDLTERLGKHFLETQERTDRTLGRTLGQNRTELQDGLLKSTQALETRFQSLEAQVGLRLESIGKSVESKLNENIKEGFKHFEKVQQHLQAAELKLASLGAVGQSISDLNNLLKLPHLRGAFGETTLERLLADFLPAGSYELQYTIPGTTERVDAVVKLARQVLPIDSKFPREQVLPLFESQDPAALDNARKMLSEFIRGEAKSIAKKYIRPDCGTADMALLFLPSETLYFEVIRNGELFESIVKLKVFPVSPNTLAISLHSIGMAQEYYEMSRGVEKTIEEIKKARRHFEHFDQRFEEVGKGLKKAQDAFETAQTHLGRYENSVFRLIGEEPALPGAGDAGSSGAGLLPGPPGEN
jgi:DNA recombination protein RmuC